MTLVKDIGGQVAPAIGTVPLASDSAVNGAAVNRSGHQSCVLILQTGTVTGAPSTKSAISKLQDSADGSTGWADIPGATTESITTNDTLKSVNVDLSTAKKYIRAVTTVALSGGTSPKFPVCGTIVLGGSDVLPAVLAS